MIYGGFRIVRTDSTPMRYKVEVYGSLTGKWELVDFADTFLGARWLLRGARKHYRDPAPDVVVYEEKF